MTDPFKEDKIQNGLYFLAMDLSHSGSICAAARSYSAAPRLNGFALKGGPGMQMTIMGSCLTRRKWPSVQFFSSRAKRGTSARLVGIYSV